MHVNGSTKLLGVLGQGIGYSLSPAIHNFSMRHLALNNVYVPFDIAASDVADFLTSFWAIGGIGLNVTKPYKGAVAKLVGADLPSVNTVFRGASGWQATSTDGEGFVLALRRLGAELASYERVVILGAGGAVVALLSQIATESSARVDILRRQASDDERLFEAVPQGFSLQTHAFDPTVFAGLLAHPSERLLIVQATSAPQNGDRLEAFAHILESQTFQGAFVDLNYGEHVSQLYSTAQAKAMPCQDGLPMLIEQALLAQRVWFGQQAPYDLVENYLRHEHVK